MSKCPHTLAVKEGMSEPPTFYNCDVSDKGHRSHKDQFNRVAWLVASHQTPYASVETGRRVVWSTDVEWRRF